MFRIERHVYPVYIGHVFVLLREGGRSLCGCWANEHACGFFFPVFFFPAFFFPVFFFPVFFFPTHVITWMRSCCMRMIFFFPSDIFLSPSLGYDAFGTKRFGRNEMGTMRGGLLWVSTKTPCSI